MVRHEGRNFAPRSHVGANQTHDYNRREVEFRNYNHRPNGCGFVENGVHHRNNDVNAQDRGVTESRRFLDGKIGAQRGNTGSAPSAIRHMRPISDA